MNEDIIIAPAIFYYILWNFYYIPLFLRLQSECGKIRTRITPNTDTFYAVWQATINFYPINFLHKSRWKINLRAPT